MKKITIRSEQSQPLVIYVADNVFAHMQPAPTAEQQTQLLEYIAVMLAKTGKTENHYLQYAYLNPAGNNQLKLYYARESAAKNIVQMNPDYKPESVGGHGLSIQIEYAQALEQSDANEKFIALQKSVKDAIKGENNPPFHKKDGQLVYINQDSKERRKAAAIKLFKLNNKSATDDEAENFAVFVVTPEDAFKTDVHEFSNRKEIIQMGEFITSISKRNNQDSDELNRYRETLAAQLQDELDNAQQATIGVITDAARQLDLNDKRTALQDKIGSYTTLRDARAIVTSRLAAAIYNAAKDYYLSIWEHDKYSLDNEIQAFNVIFGKIIHIDPTNLSFTSIEDVFAKLNASKMKTDDIEKIITDILNAAYGAIGSQKRQQSRDAIEFLIKHFNQADPDHTDFPKIERLLAKHQFRFNDNARRQFTAFDNANKQLLAVEKNDIDEIYLTGTSLVAMANEVKETAQSNFNNLSELTTLLDLSRDNLEKFPAIVAQKNEASRRLADIQEHCPKLDTIQMPATDPTLGGLSPVVAELLRDQINDEKAALQEALQVFNDKIQVEQTELDAILERAHQSAITLTPLSSDDFAADFSAANERAANMEQNLNAFQQQVEFAQMRIQIHKKDAHDILQCQLLVNALYNLPYWQTTTGTFGLQAKVTIGNQSYVVPREIGAMLNMVKDIDNEGWDSNPDTARALIAKLKNYAVNNRTSNQGVNRLYETIQSSQPANNNTPLNSIPDKIRNMGSLLPQPLARITDVETNATEVAPSRFWQRHPVLKKALIGALIGTIIPVVGTIIGAIIGTVIGKRDEKRALQPQPVQAAARQPAHILSNNPFDSEAQEARRPLLGSDARNEQANSSSEINGKLEKKYEGNPFVDPAHSDDEVDYSELDKLMEDIDKINPDEVVARLSKPNPSFFDVTAATQASYAFENDFVSNLLHAVYELKAPMTSDKSLPTLKSDMDSLQKKNWNPKEKNQGKRDDNLKNLIEILQISYRTSCTDDFITSVIRKTAEQHPQLDVRMLTNSPLKKFGILDIVSGMQKNRLI